MKNNECPTNSTDQIITDPSGAHSAESGVSGVSARQVAPAQGAPITARSYWAARSVIAARIVVARLEPTRRACMNVSFLKVHAELFGSRSLGSHMWLGEADLTAALVAADFKVSKRPDGRVLVAARWRKDLSMEAPW